MTVVVTFGNHLSLALVSNKARMVKKVLPLMAVQSGLGLGLLVTTSNLVVLLVSTTLQKLPVVGNLKSLQVEISWQIT